MADAHVDFHQIGDTYTLANPAVNAWQDTGIVLPPVDVEGLVVRVGQYTSYVFEETRLTDTDPVVAGPASPSNPGGIVMGILGAGIGALTDYIGHSAPAEGEPRGRLMVFTTQPGPEVVRLWNLVPAEIGQAELADAVSTRLLPAVTDDDAGDVLRVDDDGNWEVGAPFTVAATAPDGSVSAGQLLARFPEFALGGAAERNGGQVNNALAESYRMAGSSNTAQMWCAAHLLALVGEQTGSPDGGAGVVTSETLGPHSVSLMVDAAGSREAFFATTTYGRMLLSIESRTPKVAVGIVFA